MKRFAMLILLLLFAVSIQPAAAGQTYTYLLPEIGHNPACWLRTNPYWLDCRP